MLVGSKTIPGLFLAVAAVSIGTTTADVVVVVVTAAVAAAAATTATGTDNDGFTNQEQVVEQKQITVFDCIGINDLENGGM